jgi:integrase
MRKKRVNKGNNLHSQHDILDGLAQIFRVKQSGDVYQFRMYVKDEQKHYRKSLKTSDLETALIRGRELGMELSTNVKQGKRVFGQSIEEAVELYLDDRKTDVDSGLIVKGRWSAISTQLKHFVEIVGRRTKVSELDRGSLFEYSRLRKAIANKKTGKTVTDTTVANEQSTINHMMKFLNRKDISHFDLFDFKKIKIRQDDIGKRDTFKLEEYDKLVRFMRSYVADKNCKDENEKLERMIIRDYVLISSNSCMRVGELRQLTWGDVTRIETIFDDKEKEHYLAHINVRAETSKVKTKRKIICRGGEYFERLKKRQRFTSSEHLVFTSVNGTSGLSSQKWAKHWRALMTGIGVSLKEWKDDRNLTWYSLRHFGITMRVMSNVNILDIAKLAGTSVNHIENTYLKYKEESMRTQAMKSFSITKDGTVLEKESS